MAKRPLTGEGPPGPGDRPNAPARTRSATRKAEQDITDNSDAGDPDKAGLRKRKSAQARREKVAEFLKRAYAEFKRSYEAERTYRDEAKIDLSFSHGSGIWDEAERQKRIADRKPVMVINRFPTFERLVLNEMRQTNPAVQTNPVDSDADPDTSEAFQDIIRQTEAQSHSQDAYLQGATDMLRMGRGWWRLLTEWEGSDGDAAFRQVVRVKPIEDPWNVYRDPSARDPLYRDGNSLFYRYSFTKDEFKRKYPKAEPVSATGLPQEAPDAWRTEDTVEVLEWLYAEFVPEELVQVELEIVPEAPDGSLPPLAAAQDEPPTEYRTLTVRRADLDAQRIALNQFNREQGLPELGADEDLPRVREIQSRVVERRQIRWCIINAQEVLEGNDDRTGGRLVQADSIPFVPCIGDKYIIDGKVDYKGQVRDARDAARAYVYWVNATAEMIALAPRAPWVGFAGQFKGFEAKWQQVNQRNFPYLEANPVEFRGKFINALPQRNVAEPAIQAMMQALRQADFDLKATMGMNDASLGRSVSEESGKAALVRKQQGQVANANYLSNWLASIQYTGELLVQMLPRTLSVAQVVRLRGADGQTRKAQIGPAPQLPPGVPDLKTLAKQRGLVGFFDFSAGKYDVTVSTGPRTDSARQEAAGAMLEVLKVRPDLFPVIGDIWLNNQDWPGAREAGRRLARAVPKQFQEPDPNGPGIPELQQQVEEREAQLKQMAEQIQQLLTEKETKAQELAAKGEMQARSDAVKQQIAEMQAQVDLRIASMQAESKLALEQMAALFKKQEIVLQGKVDSIQSEQDHVQDARPERPPYPKPDAGKPKKTS